MRSVNLKLSAVKELRLGISSFTLFDVVSYERKYVQEVLVNRLFKLAQEKVWLGEMTIL